MSTPEVAPPVPPQAERAPGPVGERAEPGIEPALEDGQWQPLPLRARTLFIVTGVLGSLVPALLAFIPIGVWFGRGGTAATIAVLQLLAWPLLAAWWARKQYRHTAWKLDGIGFALRRGRLWQAETCVPTSRVQHLDIRRGPLERRFGLSTLVIHTAGTREHAVAVHGLAEEVAERVRDHLADQVDHEDRPAG